ncbi:MAG: DUF86 domain-containing protein [Candidatus Omnitrophica bacterium]|nr:DUF86 domain-containing protein [Candidatus Omnitrophota bacterium]
MSERSWKLFIEDILESIEKIQEYVKELGYEEFKIDRKTVDAVIKNLMVIGEAARNIPIIIKNKYPGIDWQGMSGLRNRIVHAYFEISVEILWQIIKNEIPVLKKELQKVLEDLDQITEIE